MNSKRIEVCGNIASGKTTLVHILKMQNFSVVFENFLENPFYQAFYQNPLKNSFETELTFHLQHYHSIKSNMNQGKTLVCDFSIFLDRAYADVTLNGRRAKLFSEVSEELAEEIGYPYRIINLKCPEETLLTRIKSRNRDAEKNISIDYLKSLTTSINNRIESLSSFREKIDIITIDSHEYNFASDLKDIQTVLKETLNHR